MAPDWWPDGEKSKNPCTPSPSHPAAMARAIAGIPVAGRSAQACLVVRRLAHAPPRWGAPMTQRTFGDFWRGWCETNGLPTKVVRQPIPAAPVQSDPDVQIMDAIAPAQKRLRIGDHVECRELAGVFRPCPCG